MIKELDSDIAENFLKKYFPSYHKGDVYEKIVGFFDKDIVGIISYSKMYERAEINYIVVVPEFRGKGIASSLMEFMLNDLNDVLSITLEVNENNKAAVNLYSKYGFKIVGTRTRYYKNENAYLMQKEMR